MPAERTVWVIATTLPTREGAEVIARELVTADLAACAQVGADLRSCYRWQGRVVQESEVALLLKVRKDRYAACAERLLALHPYETPQLLGWPAAHAAPGYLAWVYGEGA